MSTPEVSFIVFKGMTEVWRGNFEDMGDMPHDDNSLMYLVFVNGVATRVCNLSQLTTILALTTLFILEKSAHN